MFLSILKIYLIFFSALHSSVWLMLKISSDQHLPLSKYFYVKIGGWFTGSVLI